MQHNLPCQKSITSLDATESNSYIVRVLVFLKNPPSNAPANFSSHRHLAEKNNCPEVVFGNQFLPISTNIISNEGRVCFSVGVMEN